MPEGLAEAREGCARGGGQPLPVGSAAEPTGGVEGLGAHGVSGESLASVACGGDIEEGAGGARLAAPRSCPHGSGKAHGLGHMHLNPVYC